MVKHPCPFGDLATNEKPGVATAPTQEKTQIRLSVLCQQRFVDAACLA